MRQDQCDHQWETVEREVVVYTDTDNDTHYPDIEFSFCLKCSKQKQEGYESRQKALAEVLEKAKELDKPGVHGWMSMKKLKEWLEEQLES